MTVMNESKLVDVKGLSEQTGLPERTIRSMVHDRKIPCLKLGHRTLRFDPPKVRQALQKFEISAIASR
jgi:excisionase family DNA binding protein